MQSKKFWISFAVFLFSNLFLYLFILTYNQDVTFSINDYSFNAHHYLPDQRSIGGKFDLFRALGQYDAQWYLKIADTGYPKNPTYSKLNVLNIYSGLSYAFFPLYPLLISVINYPINNIEVSAFILSNILLISNFVSIYFVVKSMYSKNKALKTIFLLFLFPFSIFFRSYFTEGLFLLLLVWFSYFLIKKQWILSALFLSLLLVTRPNGIFFELIFLPYLVKAYLDNRVNMWIMASAVILSVFPFAGWLIYCFINTGNPFYWATVQSSWFNSGQFYSPLLHNLSTISNFFSLPLHSFHVSKIDTLAVVFSGIILYFSRKKIPSELWWISLLLWGFPLLVKDTMSFTRYQIVSFPLFVYLAWKIKGYMYMGTLVIFVLGLLAVSLFFVNWYWVG